MLVIIARYFLITWLTQLSFNDVESVWLIIYWLVYEVISWQLVSVISFQARWCRLQFEEGAGEIFPMWQLDRAWLQERNHKKVT